MWLRNHSPIFTLKPAIFHTKVVFLNKKGPFWPKIFVLGCFEWNIENLRVKIRLGFLGQIYRAKN